MRIGWLALLLSLPPAIAADFLIVGAKVADGTGSPLKSVSVRVSGDRIVALGNLRANPKSKPGENVIHAEGLVLAPGFIDTHNHSTEALEKPTAPDSQLAQGITTIYVGQDGGSPLPIGPYLARIRAHPSSLNVQTMVGHATVRRQVMKEDFRRPATPAEIGAMELLVDEAMQQGATGLSTGLEYEVGSYSTTEEVIALAKVAARHHGIYVSHMRDEADLTFQSIAEILRIGKEAKLPVQISHIKLGTAAVWGRATEAIALIEAARARGLDITADCYPYDAWGSTITVLIPDKQFDNQASVKKGLSDVGGPANVTITQCKAHPDYEFHTLAAIAAKENLTPAQMFSKIVKEGGAGVVVKAMKDDDIRAFYRAPWVMVGSDGGVGMRHPRGAGTYPRVFGLFVRDRQWLTLPQAIRKMTALPAWRMGLQDRGKIATGYKADLVLFHPAKIIDRSTFADPLHLPEGIAKVWVNGELVWENDRSTPARPGKVLPRTPFSPQP